MKRTGTLLLALFLGVITSNAQNYQWAKSLGGPSTDHGYSIAVDGSGNVYTTGSFQNTVDFDPGPGTSFITTTGQKDIFISKLDAAGNFLWAKNMGGTYIQEAYSIAVDGSGNVYTTGYFGLTADFDPGPGFSYLTSAGTNDIFISKLDPAGNFLWAKRIGGLTYDEGYSIAVDGSGNVYTTGNFEGTVDFDPGPGTSNLTSVGGIDMFICKLDGAGNFLWAKSMGGNSDVLGNSIAVDASGNIHTTGSFAGTVDFDPGTGTYNLLSVFREVFISKLDAAGNFLWAKSVGGNGDDRGHSIAVDASGNVYTTGRFSLTGDFDPGAGTSNLISEGSADIFILKLDSAGNFGWATSMGGLSFDVGNSIAVDGSGNVYTNGDFQGTVDFDPGPGTSDLTSAGERDVFVSKLDPAGNLVWAQSVGSTIADRGRSIAVDGSGNVLTTGSFASTADFDPGAGISNLTSAGSYDVFISKLGATSVGVMENSFGTSLTVYPTPTNGAVSINLGATHDDVAVIIRDQLGQEVLSASYSNSDLLQLSIAGEAGMYLVEVSSGNNRAILKVVKE
jgi:hypothetical protein